MTNGTTTSCFPRTILFDTVILEFRDGEGHRHLKAISLSDFDGPQRLTVAVPQEFQTVPDPLPAD